MKIVNAGRDPAALMVATVESLMPSSWAEPCDYSPDNVRMSGNGTVAAGFNL